MVKFVLKFSENKVITKPNPIFKKVVFLIFLKKTKFTIIGIILWKK